MGETLNKIKEVTIRIKQQNLTHKVIPQTKRKIATRRRAKTKDSVLMILSPLGGTLVFWNFSRDEDKKSIKMHISDNKMVAIDDYDTNLHNYKFDPLAVIKAKFAMSADGPKTLKAWNKKESALRNQKPAQ